MLPVSNTPSGAPQQSALTPEQRAEFQQNGFLILRGVVDASDCEHFRGIALQHLEQRVEPVELEADLGYPGAPTNRDAAGGQTVRRLRAAFQRDPAYACWAQDARLTTPVRELLGEPISLTLAHHNCIMTKHPDYGTATGWHRDIRYWSFERSDLICSWLALGREYEDNGSLHFIPGSHRAQILPEQLDPVDFLLTQHPSSQEMLKHACSVELAAGDLVLFHSKLFHAAGRNNSDSVKLSLVLAYHAQSNHPLPGSRSAAGGSVALPD